MKNVFPKLMYHKNNPDGLAITSQEHLEKLGKGWTDSPCEESITKDQKGPEAPLKVFPPNQELSPEPPQVEASEFDDLELDELVEKVLESGISKKHTKGKSKAELIAMLKGDK